MSVHIDSLSQRTSATLACLRDVLMCGGCGIVEWRVACSHTLTFHAWPLSHHTHSATEADTNNREPHRLASSSRSNSFTHHNSLVWRIRGTCCVNVCWRVGSQVGGKGCQPGGWLAGRCIVDEAGPDRQSRLDRHVCIFCWFVLVLLVV